MSTPSAMERLADKLAAADLDDEEMALLVSMLQGADEEVSGFAQAPFDARSARSWVGLLAGGSSSEGIAPAT